MLLGRGGTVTPDKRQLGILKAISGPPEDISRDLCEVPALLPVHASIGPLAGSSRKRCRGSRNHRIRPWPGAQQKYPPSLPAQIQPFAEWTRSVYNPRSKPRDDVRRPSDKANRPAFRRTQSDHGTSLHPV